MYIPHSVEVNSHPSNFDIYKFSDLQRLYGDSLTVLTGELYSRLIGKEFLFMVGNDLFYDQRTNPKRHIMRGLGECINGGTRQIRNLSYRPYLNCNVYPLKSYNSFSLLVSNKAQYIWVFIEKTK